MAAVPQSRSDKLLQPEVLASLSNLELIARAAVNGFLVGEAFMRAADPGAELARLFGRIG